MLIPDHPHDERLAALASADADAIDDAELTSHVAGCARCSDTVTELASLRASLADLPDLRPSRPLRLLPDVAPEAAPDPTSDRWTGLVRRVFAPLATAGAALAMVGLIGTTAPLATGMYQDSSAGGAPAEEAAGEEPAESVTTRAGGEAAPMATADALGPEAGGEDRTLDAESYGQESAAADGGEVAGALDESEDGDAGDSEALTALPAERSPWPMVLFSGVALLVVALLLRWIVVPRAG
jgi:hypothetical protein